MNRWLERQPGLSLAIWTAWFVWVALVVWRSAPLLIVPILVVLTVAAYRRRTTPPATLLSSFREEVRTPDGDAFVVRVERVQAYPREWHPQGVSDGHGLVTALYWLLGRTMYPHYRDILVYPVPNKGGPRWTRKILGPTEADALAREIAVHIRQGTWRPGQGHPPALARMGH